jgi:nitroreductase
MTRTGPTRNSHMTRNSSHTASHTDPGHPLSVLDVIFTRRSIRSYTGEPIDADRVRALLDAAAQAPTALHSNPWLFVVIQSEAVLKRYSDQTKASWLLELPSQADLYRPRGGDARRFRDELRDPEFSVFFNAGTLVVIYARAHTPFAAADCWLAAQNLILAACALGLGTCIVASASNALDSAEAKVEFGLPAEAVAVAPIVVGVPDRNAIEPAERREPRVVYWK